MKTYKRAYTDVTSETIDRNSYEPAYLQLANILRRQVAAGYFDRAKINSLPKPCSVRIISSVR
jgi:hypothetical protein